MRPAASSFSLALLVLLSSLSLHVNLHFCGDHLREVSLMGEAGACCAEAMAHGATTANTDRGCCHDESVFLKAQDRPATLAGATSALPLPLIAIPALPLLTSWGRPLEAANEDTFRPYRPPLLAADLPVLLQVFRI